MSAKPTDRRFWAREAWLDGRWQDGVLLCADAQGRWTELAAGVAQPPAVDAPHSGDRLGQRLNDVRGPPIVDQTTTSTPRPDREPHEAHDLRVPGRLSRSAAD